MYLDTMFSGQSVKHSQFEMRTPL